MLDSSLRIDYWLLGFRKLSVDVNDISKAANAFLNEGIAVSFSSRGEAKIPLYRVSRAVGALSGNVKYELSGICGLPGHLMACGSRYGMIIGLILALFIGIYTYGLVWDVRVEGDEVRDGYVINALHEAGFGVGSRWDKSELSEIESRVLLSSDKIGWININRRGSVAYVEVRKRSNNTETVRPSGFRNLVASADATVEEIRLISGAVSVKVGESVKAGELLISGVMANGELCYAEGEVRARVYEEVEVSVGREKTVREYGAEHLASLKIQIFGKTLNIYENYGNLDKKCVIIEKTKVFSLPGGIKLPFSVKKEYETEYEERAVLMSDAEMIALASYRLKAKTVSCLAGADLVRISTEGGFTDSGYVMRSEIIAVRDICREVRIFADGTR